MMSTIMFYLLALMACLPYKIYHEISSHQTDFKSIALVTETTDYILSYALIEVRKIKLFIKCSVCLVNPIQHELFVGAD